MGPASLKETPLLHLPKAFVREALIQGAHLPNLPDILFASHYLYRSRGPFQMNKNANKILFYIFIYLPMFQKYSALINIIQDLLGGVFPPYIYLHIYIYNT